MIYAILLIPVALATWFSYWVTSVLGGASKESRMVSLLCPAIFAVILAVFFSMLLGTEGTVTFLGLDQYSIQGSGRLWFREVSATLLLIAILLAGLSIPIAIAAGKLAKSNSEKRTL